MPEERIQVKSISQALLFLELDCPSNWDLVIKRYNSLVLNCDPADLSPTLPDDEREVFLRMRDYAKAAKAYLDDKKDKLEAAEPVHIIRSGVLRSIVERDLAIHEDAAVKENIPQPIWDFYFRGYIPEALEARLSFLKRLYANQVDVQEYESTRFSIILGDDDSLIGSITSDNMKLVCFALASEKIQLSAEQNAAMLEYMRKTLLSEGRPAMLFGDDAERNLVLLGLIVTLAEKIGGSDFKAEVEQRCHDNIKGIIKASLAAAQGIQIKSIGQALLFLELDCPSSWDLVMKRYHILTRTDPANLSPMLPDDERGVHLRMRAYAKAAKAYLEDKKDKLETAEPVHRVRRSQPFVPGTLLSIVRRDLSFHEDAAVAQEMENIPKPIWDGFFKPYTQKVREAELSFLNRLYANQVDLQEYESTRFLDDKSLAGSITSDNMKLVCFALASEKVQSSAEQNAAMLEHMRKTLLSKDKPSVLFGHDAERNLILLDLIVALAEKVGGSDFKAEVEQRCHDNIKGIIKGHPVTTTAQQMMPFRFHRQEKQGKNESSPSDPQESSKSARF